MGKREDQPITGVANDFLNKTDAKFAVPEPVVVDPVEAQILTWAARIAATYVETEEVGDGNISVLRLPENNSKREQMGRAEELLRELLVTVGETREGMPAEEQTGQTMPTRIQHLPDHVDGVMVAVLRTAARFHSAELPELKNLTVTPVGQTNRFSVRLPRLQPGPETSFLNTVSYMNNCVRTVDQIRFQAGGGQPKNKP